MAAIETPPDTPRSGAGLAWLVTLVVAAGLILIVAALAMTQDNTRASIDGTTATTSQYISD